MKPKEKVFTLEQMQKHGKAMSKIGAERALKAYKERVKGVIDFKISKLKALYGITGNRNYHYAFMVLEALNQKLKGVKWS